MDSRRRADVQGSPGNLQDLSCIHPFADRTAKGRQRLPGIELLVGDEPHVPLRDRVFRQPGQRTEHREIRVLLHGPGQDGPVALAGRSVEDHARELEIRFEPLTTEDQGGHGPGHLGAVYDQKNRGLEELGEFGGGAAALDVLAVIQAAAAFDDREVHPECAFPENGLDLLGRHEKRVQIRRPVPGG
jgi:hypothetical protein